MLSLNLMVIWSCSYDSGRKTSTAPTLIQATTPTLIPIMTSIQSTLLTSSLENILLQTRPAGSQVKTREPISQSSCPLWVAQTSERAPLSTVFCGTIESSRMICLAPLETVSKSSGNIKGAESFSWTPQV